MSRAGLKGSADNQFIRSQPAFSIKAIALVIAVAVLNAFSLMYVNYILAWLAFPFLFYMILKATSKRQVVLFGCLFGAVSSFLLNFWMIPVVHQYAQGSMLLGVACWVASAIMLGLLFGFQFYLYSILKLSTDKKYAFISNALLMGCLWVLFEWFRAECFSGIPWLSYSVGITQSSNLLLIQPAAFGGAYILSFLILFPTCFISYAFFKKQWKWLYIPILTIILQFTIGFLLYEHIQEEIKHKSEHKFSVALALAALPPETVWNENSANALVDRLLSLNRQAVAQEPDLIVWSETIVPWTYAPDDDFLAVITKETEGKKIYTLLGMNSDASASGNILFNSAYLLNPAGKLAGRYDKQSLLTFVEKPLFHDNGDLILPFLAESGMKMFSGGHDQPIATPWGKAGVLLCNEATYSAYAGKLVRNGASYLVNMGNDSWFSEYFIRRQHFYNARLRAVETRKDILINNNMGISGVVRASGEIAARYNGKSSSVEVAEVIPNHIAPNNPQYFIYFILCISTILLINPIYFMFKSNNVK